jgi:hypothetical protein
LLNGSLGTADPDPGDLEKLVAKCRRQLPPTDRWAAFEGYPDSLALAVIDAIWSVGTRYSITAGVISRYRRQRSGDDAAQDSLSNLLDLYESLGGVEAFIDRIGTRNRVSTRPGAVFKGTAVCQAAQALTTLGMDTASDFRDAASTDLATQARDAWFAVPGQGSGVSWRYLRMLVGLPDVKPDRMILRFVAAALGISEQAVKASRAVALVMGAAERIGVDPRTLDHEIWIHQTARRHDSVSSSEGP